MSTEVLHERACNSPLSFFLSHQTTVSAHGHHKKKCQERTLSGSSKSIAIVPTMMPIRHSGFQAPQEAASFSHGSSTSSLKPWIKAWHRHHRMKAIS